MGEISERFFFFFFCQPVVPILYVWFQKQELDTAAEDNNKATLAMQGKQNKTHQTHLNAIPLSIWAFICIPVIWTCANMNSFATSFLHVQSWDKPAIPSGAIIHNGTLLLAQ